MEDPTDAMMGSRDNGTVSFTWIQGGDKMVSHYSILMETIEKREFKFNFNFTSSTKSIIIPTSGMYNASLTTFSVCGGRSGPVSFQGINYYCEKENFVRGGRGKGE